MPAPELYYEVHGAEDRPPLVLLHGFTGSSQTWDPFRAELATRARLILVDLIGHGQSPLPEDVSCYSMAACVDAVLAVLDRLRLPRANVFGYSMGGRVALSLAVAAPERVQRLLLESASPGIEDPAERSARRAADDALAERIERDGIAAFVADWERQPLLQLAQHVVEDVRDAQHQQRLRNNPRGLANSLRGMGAGQQPSVWFSLPSLQVPTHLLVGERDARYRAIASRMRELLPNAQLTVSPAAGHTVHLDQPAQFTAWLKEIDNAGSPLLDCLERLF